MVSLADELIKSQQQAIDFLKNSGVHYKEIEQKQNFLDAIKNSMQAAHEAILDLMSAANRTDVQNELYIEFLQRQASQMYDREYFLTDRILKSMGK